MELGKVRPGRLEPPRFETADGVQRSANEITKAFFEDLLRYTEAWIGTRGLKKATRVLIAEPLALDKSEQVGQDWLSNYRQRVKAILSSHFEEIDFLPEPFAVFQYYRYGIRHPLVATATKHVALVVDFGGGTFDVCVVETTAAGDVSAGGRNSKPLAAASIPVGGKFINDAIARELIYENLSPNSDRAQLSKAWSAYDAHTSDISRDLAPFMYWTQKDSRGQSTVAILDSHSSERSAYRTIEFGQEISISENDSELSELHALCLDVGEYDKPLPNYRSCGLVMVQRTQKMA